MSRDDRRRAGRRGELDAQLVGGVERVARLRFERARIALIPRLAREPEDDPRLVRRLERLRAPRAAIESDRAAVQMMGRLVRAENLGSAV